LLVLGRFAQNYTKSIKKSFYGSIALSFILDDGFLKRFSFDFERSDHWICLSFIFGENGRVSRSNSGDHIRSRMDFMLEEQFFAGIGPAHFPAAWLGY
jgi:hypothetical protein